MEYVEISFVDTSTSAYSSDTEFLSMAGTQYTKFMQKGNIIHEAGEDVEVAQNRFKKPQELEQGSQCYQKSSFLPPLGLIFADSLQPHGRDDDNWQFQLPIAQVNCPRGKNVLLLESRLPVSKNSLIEHIWVLAHGPITVTSSKGTGIFQFYMRCPSLQPSEMNAMTDILSNHRAGQSLPRRKDCC